MLLVRVMLGNSDEGHQLRAVDRLAFEQQFDDLIECGAMFREQCGRFCRTSPNPPHFHHACETAARWTILSQALRPFS